MATDHNFRIKNGLEVGGQLIVTSSGALVVSSVQSSLSFLDNVKAKFGNGSDLQIYHDGSHSYIRDVGTGNLKLQGTNLNLQNEGGTKNYLVAVNSGAVQLYHNNNSKIQTTSTGINVTGRIDLDDSNTQLSSGGGNSLKIQTNSGYTEVGAQNTGWSHFYTDRPRFYFSRGITVDTGLIGSHDEDLQIQRAGTTKLTVTTTGVAIDGDLSITGDLNTVNTTTLDVSDKVITAGVGGTAATNSGGGFKISGANVEFIWDNTNTQMTLNKDLKFTASEKLRFGNAYFNKSGDSNNVHFYAPAGFIPHSTTASNNASLGASSYRWNGVYSNSGNFSGNVTVGGDIIAADSNSNSNPTITFSGHTDTGLALYDEGGTDRLNFVVDGVSRGHANVSGLWSSNSLYTSSTGSFRNYSGVWGGTTALSGNGFYFLNTNGGNTTKAMELSHDGNVVFAGTISSGAITALHGTTHNISISPTSTGGVLNVRNSSGTSVVVMDGRGTPFIDVTGNLKTGGTTRIDSSGNLTNIALIDSATITATSGTDQRVLKLKQASTNTGNIIQFIDQAGANQWEITGRNNGFYIYKNTGTGSGMRYQISSSGNHTFTGNTSFNGTVSATGGNSTNWNTAYGWGDHGSAGYLTSSSTQSKYLRSDTADTATGALTFTGNINQTAGTFISNGDQVSSLTTAWQAAGTSKDRGLLPFRFQNGATGQPEGGDNAHWGLNIYAHAGSSGNYPYGTQLSAGSTQNLWHRWWANGANQAWRKIWDSANDGSGSGLDADLLDGHQASSFLRSDADDTYTGTLLLAGAIKDSGESRSIRLMHGNTNSQPSIGIGEQGTFGMKMRWDSGSKIIFDGYWSSSVTGTRNRDLGYINVNTRVWALPSGVTINANTAWHAGNDGSGSGLDADTLDSIQASSFIRSDATDTATGALTFSSTANHFNGHIYYDAFDANGNHYPHYLSGSSNNGAQVNLRVQQSGGGGYDVLYIPNGSNDITWRGNKVWNAGNDGSGSGLDADTVDSIQASSFLRSDTSDTFGNNTLTIQGTVRSTNNANASGPNFNVSTTNKSNTEYAYRVDRSGSVVGGIRIDGILIAPGGNSTNWNTAYGWGNYASAPSAPGITSTTVVNETIEIVFAASTSTGNTAATSYEVWSDGGTGSDYSLIAKIPYNDIASSMSVVDSSFDDSGTIAYRVYAIRHGAYSTASTTTRSFSMPSLDVSSMSVIPDTNSFHIQYELPDTRFLDHVEIYKDAETTSGALARSGAALIYTGRNPSYKYNIGSSDMEKYHQFWVEVVTV